MGTKTKPARRGTRPQVAQARLDFLRKAARAKNLIGGQKSHTLSARLDDALVTAAKKRTGISSDTELVELALASLAMGDDFGEWLISQGGRLRADFEIDL